MYAILALEPWLRDFGCIFGAPFAMLAIIFAADKSQEGNPDHVGSPVGARGYHEVVLAVLAVPRPP